MARLSNHTREKMATALVKHRFAERAATLIAESQELFRLAYDHHHSAEDRKHIAALTKRHPRGLGKDTSLNLNISGRRLIVGAQQIGKYWSAEVEARYTLGDADQYPGMGIEADSALGKRAIAFADAERQLQTDVGIAYKEALGALSQFSTGKRLADDWPEAMPVIGDLIPEDDRTLPVVQVAGLNSKFKLPPADMKVAA
jgi:hypothetical protein